MEKNEIRSYILIRWNLKIDAPTIHKELVDSFGDLAPSLRTVYRWIARFSTGEESTKDEPRCGRPITESGLANIERVRLLIEENPHISYTYLEAETGICRGTLHRIIHDGIGMKKLTSRWVPHYLTQEQKKKRVLFCQQNLDLFNEGKWRLSDVMTGDESWIYHRKINKRAINSSWVYEGEEPRTVVKRDRYEPKSMFSIFFKSTGPLHIDCMDKGVTIDHKYYIDNCLKPTLATLKQQRPTSGLKNMKILHDNAKPHVHINVKNFLEQEGITIIDHPPYSPDLAPCDFWLFDEIKRRLHDHCDAESLMCQITDILNLIPKDEYLKTLKKWLERMQLCIDNEGDYFEHFIK